jgi:hypothetical protein
MGFALNTGRIAGENAAVYIKTIGNYPPASIKLGTLSKSKGKKRATSI